MKTPVVIIIYNRAVHTLKLINKIRSVAPKNIYVLADGPRTSNETDIDRCNETRSIIDQIDWDCKVKKIYSENNLGLERRIVSGLNFVFESEDVVIVLEDDCHPDDSFFQFCTELLDLYRKNNKIAHISGSKYLSLKENNESYYFSRYSIEWGWATWKDRWVRYDGNMKDWPKVKGSREFENLFHDRKTNAYWTWIFDNCYAGTINSWAYKWLYKNLIDGTFSIIPNNNLIRNVGLGADSTNTKTKNVNLLQPVIPIEFPLIHPKKIFWNDKLDSLQAKQLYNKSTLWLDIITKRVKPLISRLMN